MIRNTQGCLLFSAQGSGKRMFRWSLGPTFSIAFSPRQGEPAPSGILKEESSLIVTTERLILGWEVQRAKWINMQSGVGKELMNAALDNLLRRAGSSTFRSGESVPNLSTHESVLLLTDLAPCQRNEKTCILYSAS